MKKKKSKKTPANSPRRKAQKSKKKRVLKRTHARKKAKRVRVRKAGDSMAGVLELNEQLDALESQLESLWTHAEKTEERLQDVEIHVNLITRLFTTFCVEKFGMRIGVLKRLIKRIEGEAIRDSQINHLESLYKMTHDPSKIKRPRQNPTDPWDEVS